MSILQRRLVRVAAAAVAMVGWGAVIVAPTGASASFVVSLQAGSDAGYSSFFDGPPGRNSNSFDAILLPQSSVAFHDVQSIVGALGSTRSEVNHIAELGHLQGFYQGLSVLSPTTPGLGFPTFTNGSGFGSMEWRDTFTITSSVLPVGTPVDLVARLAFESSINAVGHVEPAAGFQEVRTFLFSPGGVLELAQVGATGPQSSSDSSIFSVPVGDSFGVRGVMQLAGLTLAFFDPPDGGFEPVSNLEIDALSSATFGIEILTPGATYVADSGTIYPTVPGVSAVPLPAALPLFLSALAGLGLMGWRRRQAGGSCQ